LALVLYVNVLFKGKKIFGYAVYFKRGKMIYMYIIFAESRIILIETHAYFPVNRF
jgi:hypothetical protein